MARASIGNFPLQWLVLALFLLRLEGASADGQKRLAVLELEVADGVKVDRVVFSDLARSAVNKSAPELFVMTRESTEALLQANGKTLADCTGDCEVEVGRKLGADYIISGRIAQLGKSYYLTVRLFSTADGRLLQSADVKAASPEKLADQEEAALAGLIAPLKILTTPAVRSPADTNVSKITPAGNSPPAMVRAGELRVEPKSGLEFIQLPGGTFHFGCEPRDAKCAANEKPGREATVEPLWLGKTDVTVAAYQKCIAAGACDKLVHDDDQHRCNLENARADHPINCIAWSQAVAFCAWLGGRLPTEEEWEFAAKSGESRIYPWGDQPLDATRANTCDQKCHQANANFRSFSSRIDDGYAATSPAGAFPAGASKWGLLDMAGDVWQWTATDYNSSSKVARGGAWNLTPRFARASSRFWNSPAFGQPYIGLRCAMQFSK